MIKLLNCSVADFEERSNGGRIIPFGTGAWFKMLETPGMEFLANRCPYAIDNSRQKSFIQLGKRDIPVFAPEALRTERDCIVLLTSPVYMYDMYQQLCALDCEGDIDCYCLAFMTLEQKAHSTDAESEKALATVINENAEAGTARIPKIIHGFWFSGEEKPPEYKRCFDTWGDVCPGYKIIEWNRDNYDCDKNPFVKRAIECGAWAFAADYARLDVLREYGGFYLDMDVELLRPLDSLLSNRAVLPFSNSATIDLAVIGSEPKNELLDRLLNLYANVDLPNTKDGFKVYFQPSFIRRALIDYGVEFNGCLQIINGNAFVPRTFFYPMDYVTFTMSAKSDNTYAIHHDNFGWSPTGIDARAKKIKENRLLRSLISSE